MRKFDKEFKKEAVKKCLDGQSLASVSREIGVNENTNIILFADKNFSIELSLSFA
jgi:hypothetical protein